MRTVFRCLLMLVAFDCSGAWAGNIDCVRFFHVGDTKICMKTLKETSPALAVLDDNVIYYASTTPESLHGMRVRYQGHDYSLYNRDDTEYELIHWLSGEDALVDDVWRDRLADTTSDPGGALNFTNHGCEWNEEHTGYYSADGWKQYFQTTTTPQFDFGSDWYMEVIAKVGEPLGTSCVFVDLGSLCSSLYGVAISTSNRLDETHVPGRILANIKIKVDKSVTSNTGDVAYTWDTKSVFTVGVSRYSINQSRSFVTWDGNRYYGDPFATQSWNEWRCGNYLFYGFSKTWIDANGFNNVYHCGPTTIYDIKIWRKK